MVKGKKKSKRESTTNSVTTGVFSNTMMPSSGNHFNPSELSTLFSQAGVELNWGKCSKTVIYKCRQCKWGEYAHVLGVVSL